VACIVKLRDICECSLLGLYITIQYFLWPISYSSCHWADDGSMKCECVCVFMDVCEDLHHAVN